MGGGARAAAERGGGGMEGGRGTLTYIYVYERIRLNYCTQFGRIDYKQ